MSAAECRDVITALDVIYGEGAKPPDGFHKIDADLNKGAGGEFVYLCYSTTVDAQPITNMQVFAGDGPSINIQEGYEIIWKDLNKGAGGKYLYVCFTRSAEFRPIREVSVVQSQGPEVYPPTVEWVRVGQDCSAGAGGYYSYITFKRS